MTSSFLGRGVSEKMAKGDWGEGGPAYLLKAKDDVISERTPLCLRSMEMLETSPPQFKVCKYCAYQSSYRERDMAVGVGAVNFFRSPIYPRVL